MKITTWMIVALAIVTTTAPALGGTTLGATGEDLAAIPSGSPAERTEAHPLKDPSGGVESNQFSPALSSDVLLDPDADVLGVAERSLAGDTTQLENLRLTRTLEQLFEGEGDDASKAMLAARTLLEARLADARAPAQEAPGEAQVERIQQATAESLREQLEKMDRVEEVFRINDDADIQDDVHRATLIALALDSQPAALGLEPRTTSAQQPSEAVRDLASHHGLSLSSAQEAEAQALDDLRPDRKRALADLVEAYLAFDAATREAFSDVDPADVRDLRPFDAEADPASERLVEDWDAANPGAAHRLPHDVPSVDAATLDKTLSTPSGLDALEEMGVDLDPVAHARADLLRATVAAHGAWADSQPGAGDTDCSIVDLAPALTLDLNGCNTLYTENAALQLDIGGDDEYLNNAGGGSLLESHCPPAPVSTLAASAGAAALVDLGGDDAYGDPTEAAGCGTNGGGYGGTSGFLFDAAGNDTYFAGLEQPTVRHDPAAGTFTGQYIGSMGVNGGSHVGTGFLLDIAGQDAYFAGVRADEINIGIIAGSGGVNGGGHIGTGALLDLRGADSYFAGIEAGTVDADSYVGAGGLSVNGGGYIGAGALVDLGGDDTYRAGVWANDVTADGGVRAGDGGVNGGSRQGYGFLVDGAGDDRFKAGAFISGNLESSGWQGLGRHAVNGGAISEGSALLVDRGGDDVVIAGARIGGNLTSESGVYVADWGINGGAMFFGTGGIVSGGGDDVYRAGLTAQRLTAQASRINIATFGVNGGANNGIGLLVDAEGEDTYLAEADIPEIHRPGVVGPSYLTVASGGVNGGAVIMGAAAIVDGQGADRYHARAETETIDYEVSPIGTLKIRAVNHAVNGGGEGGIISTTVPIGAGSQGYLGDFGAEDDEYVAYLRVNQSLVVSGLTAATYGVNGAARMGGSGFIYDAGGNETYRASADAGEVVQHTNTRPVTGKVPHIFRASSSGVNGGGDGAGSSGTVVDRSGHDVYEAIFNVSSIDTDRVQTVQGGSHGVNGGSAGAKGSIFDGGGNDRYMAGLDAGVIGPIVHVPEWLPTNLRGIQGGTSGVNGGTYGTGVFVYSSVLTSTFFGGKALVWDRGGDDRYEAFATAEPASDEDLVPARGVNGAAEASSWLVGMEEEPPVRDTLAALVDRDGTDTYVEHDETCIDCTVLPKGEFGVQYDSTTAPGGDV